MTSTALPADAVGFDGSSLKNDSAAVDAAREALANAKSTEVVDTLNHGPGCVQTDQKVIDKDKAQLAAAASQARSAGVLDIVT